MGWSILRPKTWLFLTLAVVHIRSHDSASPGSTLANVLTQHYSFWWKNDTNYRMSAIFYGVIWDKVLHSHHSPSLGCAERGDQYGFKLLITSGHIIGYCLSARAGSCGVTLNCRRDQAVLFWELNGF